MVDLPEAGSPVSHTVAPLVPSVAQRVGRSRPLSCQVTSGLRCECASPSRTSRTRPAATVSFVWSSTRMKAPVVRLSS